MWFRVECFARRLAFGLRSIFVGSLFLALIGLAIGIVVVFAFGGLWWVFTAEPLGKAIGLFGAIAGVASIAETKWHDLFELAFKTIRDEKEEQRHMLAGFSKSRSELEESLRRLKARNDRRNASQSQLNDVLFAAEGGRFDEATSIFESWISDQRRAAC